MHPGYVDRIGNLLRCWLFSSLACLAVSAIADTAGSGSAELVLHNASIYTFDWGQPSGDGTPSPSAPFDEHGWHPDANSIAIANGEILAVGKGDALSSHIGEQTLVIDLQGATLLPGFVDSHVHIAELGEILANINLIGLDTPEAVVAKVRESVDGTDRAAGTWIVGQGWDEGAWADKYPTKGMLDEAFPDNPVVLKSLHGFGVWANGAALEAIGIDGNTADPVGGTIVRSGQGEPTGIFLNRATEMIKAAIPEPTADEFEQWVRLGLDQMTRDGFVGVHQAGAETRHMNAFSSLRDAGQLPVRVYAMLSARDSGLAEKWIKRGPATDEAGWLDVRSVKAYYDGTLGSRSARLLQDYSDMPGHRGISGDGYGYDEEIVQRLMAAGFQVGIHAIGDAGNRETLDFIEGVYRKHPGARDNRHRIEHAQVVAPGDIDRFVELDVIASMEPAHAVEDKTWAEQRLGPQRIRHAYAWRSLARGGVRLLLNSDLPGSDHSIFYGLHAAVTRQDKQGLPEGGWYASQALTIEEAVRGFTVDAAYAGFGEHRSGVIKPGMWADLSVIDRDIMRLADDSPGAILDGRIVMTIVNGEIRYRSKP